MKKYSYDAVVIGTGCAGYNCADWLFDLGVTSVAIVTEGENKGTSRNTGSDKQTYYKLSLAGEDGDSVRLMAKTLYDGGAMDGDVALSEASNSVRSFIKLNNLGVDFPTNEFGEYVGYKTDHDPRQRATSIGPYTSKKMTEALEKAVKSKGIDIIDKCQVIRILTEGDRAVGLLALDLNDKNVGFVAIEASFVILATGGPASVYYDSVYPVGHTGSSSLALNAGAEMRNLSEWQYGLASTDFRWNVSGTYQQVLPRYVSVDSDGVEREFLLDYFATPEEMLKNVFLKGYEWPFDVRKINGSSLVDLAVYNETNVLGREVYMDFTKEPTGLSEGFDKLDEVVKSYLENSDALVGLPIERLRIMNPSAISLYADHGIDITAQPLKIAVCAQHNNGGASVDKDRQTTVKGLYAVGEVAGTLGIFRPGGSALNSCQTGGLCVAKHVAYEAERKLSNSFDDILSEAVKDAEAFICKAHGEKCTLEKTLERYQKRMSKSFAFIRDEEQMQIAEKEIENAKASFFEDNEWSERSQIPALFKNYDVICMQSAIAKSMIYTASRYGSRGSGMVTKRPFMQRQIVPENARGREKVVCVRQSKELELYEKVVKPIPDGNLWFEKVWKEHRERTEKRK